MFLIEQTHFLISSRVYFPLFSLLFHHCFFRRNFSVPVNEINLNEFFEIKIPATEDFGSKDASSPRLSSDLYAGFYGYFSDLADTFGEVSQNE